MSCLLSDFSSEITSSSLILCFFSFIFYSVFINDIVLIPFTLQGTIKFFLLVTGFINSFMTSSSSSSIYSFEFHLFIAARHTVAISSSSFINSSSKFYSASFRTYSSPFSPTLNISFIASVLISRENPIFGFCFGCTFSSSKSYKGFKKSNLEIVFGFYF